MLLLHKYCTVSVTVDDLQMNIQPKDPEQESLILTEAKMTTMKKNVQLQFIK